MKQNVYYYYYDMVWIKERWGKGDRVNKEWSLTTGSLELTIRSV